MRRFSALLCAALIGLAAAPVSADVIDPEEEEQSDDDSACSVAGFGHDDATPFAPLLLGVLLLGAVRRREG